jgi:hypothetical protein
MNGAPRRLSLFCFAKKVSKKGEPAALLFVFRFVVALFLLPIGRRAQTRCHLQLKPSSPRSSNMCSPTAPERQQK